MELKLTSGGVGIETPSGSNRTFMELKYECSGCIITNNRVLIVPLWN